MPPKKYHTITEIVSTLYCEQKMVFDRERGRSTSVDVNIKAAQGRFEHKRFEVEGYSKLMRNPLRFVIHSFTRKRYQRQLRNNRDARCFIASQIYGADAAETQFLRAWRDRRLMQSYSGRTVVHLYYVVSPLLVVILKRSKYLNNRARLGVDYFLKRLGRLP